MQRWQSCGTDRKRWNVGRRRGGGLLLDESDETWDVVFGRGSRMDVDFAFRVKQFDALGRRGVGNSVVAAFFVVRHVVERC